jgi:hypothetical protein
VTDTVRTTAALQTLFRDSQAVGTITPQTVRDLIASLDVTRSAIINVKDTPYSAVGNGVADDTVPIQAAITAAAIAGGKVLFPAGTYLISSTLSVAGPGVTLRGSGLSSIIKPSIATFNLVTPTIAAHRLKVQDIWFQGAAVGDTTTQFGIFTGASAAPDDVEVSGCFFGMPTAAATSLNSGIKIDGGNGWNVHHNKIKYPWGIISGTGYGVLAGTTNRLHAHDNEYLGTTGRGRHGIYLSGGCTYCDVHDNHAEGLSEDAFPIFSYSYQTANTNNHVHHNTSLNCGQLTADSAAFSVTGNSSQNLVDNNRAINFQGNGYLVAALGVAAQTDRNVFRGNWSYFCQNYGLLCEGAQNTDIVGNTFADSSQVGSNGYAAIAVRPSGAVAASNTAVRGNRGTGALLRSGLDLTGAVLATGLRVYDNYFPEGVTSKIDNPNSVVFDGRNNDFGLVEVSADRGDASQTLTAGSDSEIQLWATLFTGNHTVTLSTTGAYRGAKFRIVRTGLGSFTLDVGGLKTIASATAATVDVAFTGTAWVLVGYGAL